MARSGGPTSGRRPRQGAPEGASTRSGAARPRAGRARDGRGRRPSSRPPRDRGPRDHPALDARNRRHRALRRRITAAVVLLAAVGGLVWLLAFSPVFDVRDVEVTGASPEALPAVRDAAAVPPETSLLWLSTSDLDARVATIPRVASVDVRRSLPGTVTVTVSEREPVAAVPLGPAVALVDDTGFAYRTLPAPPPGIPRLVLPPAVAPSPADPATVAAVRVLGALPPALRRTVTEVRAASAYDVSFTVDGGRTVRWGADGEDERKAAVLGPLLTRPGQTFDVSTPELPVVS
ncbi:cell division protein FtsQ/DivIB [Actinomycetospora atypica]|uniref:Cell division protein FtsQ/DivIB n=1 Tax=Actinomycetospora atypica TaxID=1290095 RepID=A0ABV9YJU5_9PSEU